MKRGILITGLLLLPLLLATVLTKLTFNNEHWLSEEDWVQVNQRHNENTFFQDESLVFIISQQSLFTSEVIEQLKRAGHSLKRLPGVYDVKSPIHANFVGKQDETVHILPYYQALEQNILQDIQHYQKHFIKSRYWGKLMTEQGDKFLLILNVDVPDENAQAYRQNLLFESQKILDKHPSLSHYNPSGDVFLNSTINELTKQSLMKLALTALLLFMILLWFIDGNWYKLWVVLYSAVTSGLLALWAVVAISGPITSVSLILPIVIMAIAISDSIHIIARWRSMQTSSIKRLIKLTFTPCLITSITTSIGFGSFAFSNILPLQQLGMSAFIAILLAYIVIVGSNWMWIGILKDKLHSRRARSHLLSQSTFFVLSASERYPKAVYGSVLAILVMSGALLTTLSTEANFLKVFFRESNSVYQNLTALDKDFSGSGAVDLLLKNDEPEYYKTMKGMQEVQTIKTQLQHVEAIRDVQAYTDYVEETYPLLSYEKAALPNSDEALQQILFFLEMSRGDEDQGVLAEYLNFDGDNTRIHLKTNNLSSSEMTKLLEEIKSKTSIPDQSFAGSSIYSHQINQYVMPSQMQSLILTLSVIFLVMFFVYGFAIALTAVLLTSIPVLITYAVIALFKVPFDFSVILVMSVSFSIAIDNVIHLLHHYKALHDAKHTDHVHHCFKDLSQPLTLNTLLFCACFLLFTTAELLNLSKFGLFSTVSLLLAWLVSILLFSAMTKVFFKPE